MTLNTRTLWRLSTVSGLTLAGLYGCYQGSDTPQGPSDPNPTPKAVDALIGGVSVSSSSLNAVGVLGFDNGYGGTGGVGGSAGTAGVGGSVSVGGSAGTGWADGGFGAIGGGGGSGKVRAQSSGSGGCGPYGCSPYPVFTPFCVATLVGPKTVLTTASCASSAVYNHVKFAIGANAHAPNRLVDVVHVSYAPSGDLAIAHLAEAVTNVSLFPTAEFTGGQIGQAFAALSFGNDRNSGIRTGGAVTLRGLEGRTLEFAFGDFEAYYEYARYQYPGTGGVGGLGGFAGAAGIGGSYPIPAFDGGSAGVGGDYYPGTGGTGGDMGGSPGVGGTGVGGAPGGSAGVGGAPGGSAGVGGSGYEDPWLRERLLSNYNNTLLAPGTAFLGGAPGDAQQCGYSGVDQGGPVLRKVGSSVRLFGVFLNTPVGDCSRGGIYAEITPEIQAFIAEAQTWTDPCDGVPATGRCDGTTAVRCVDVNGERSVTRFDCDLLDQVCVANYGADVACSDQ